MMCIKPDLNKFCPKCGQLRISLHSCGNKHYIANEEDWLTAEEYDEKVKLVFENIGSELSGDVTYYNDGSIYIGNKCVSQILSNCAEMDVSILLSIQIKEM